jgi:hypothetical protein
MERVLEIVLEVENLTADERSQVQGGLTSIQLDVTETSQNTNPEEAITDLSGLINIRYRHQSEEEARAVHVARAQTSLGGDFPHSDLNEGVHPHRLTAAASQDTKRQQLAKKINSIVKASAAVSESTGLNRRARWKTDKVAAGSTLPVGETVTALGNTANAQATARKAAQAVSFSFDLTQLHSILIHPCIIDCETACQCICTY